MTFKWNTKDRYLSNDGKGPLMARIVSVKGRIVTMERWNMKHKRPRPKIGRLSVQYLTSEHCAWKKVAKTAQ